MPKVRWNWKGEKLTAELREAVSDGLVEIGGRAEMESKRELEKGHGVVTGTLRRSIHTADPDYTWADDNMAPSATSPERGGRDDMPKEVDGKLILQLGSGLEYAMAVHQGHGSFEGYHYLTHGIDKVRSQAPGIVKKHTSKVTVK